MYCCVLNEICLFVFFAFKEEEKAIQRELELLKLKLQQPDTSVVRVFLDTVNSLKHRTKYKKITPENYRKALENYRINTVKQCGMQNWMKPFLERHSCALFFHFRSKWRSFWFGSFTVRFWATVLRSVIFTPLNLPSKAHWLPSVSVSRMKNKGSRSKIWFLQTESLDTNLKT